MNKEQGEQKVFFAYLRSHIKSIMMFCLFTLVFSVVFLLYSLPLEPVAYAALLCICTGLCFFASGYFRFIRRHRLLKQLLVTITLNDEGLPVTEDLLEKDYQELVRAVHDDKLRIASEADAARAELIEYYTLWAHQIKNPIAAISLLLQSNVESLGSAGSAEASAGNPAGNSAVISTGPVLFIKLTLKTFTVKSS
ncbi:MAG: hypothetical protein HGA22_02365 [Clostridiales bacterium]|nr:hypothetical protein [Clostridiales bacterium]